jgi:hypothetical protein
LHPKNLMFRLNQQTLKRRYYLAMAHLLMNLKYH